MTVTYSLEISQASKQPTHATLHFLILFLGGLTATPLKVYWPLKRSMQ